MSTPSVLDTREEWTADALDVITHLASTGVPFTADDLHDRLREAPHGNLVGRVFQIASRRGLIVPVGYTESHHPTRRGGGFRVWSAPTP